MTSYYDSFISVIDELCRLGKTREEAGDMAHGAVKDYINESITGKVPEQKKRMAKRLIQFYGKLGGEFGVDYTNDRVVYFPNEAVEAYVRRVIDFANTEIDNG